MAAASDPRVFFAAERTLLAWIRTAIGLMGLGFVVARFSVFLQILDRQAGEAATHHASPWIGVGLAALGALTAGLATGQHARFRRSLREPDLPVGYRTGVALAVGFGVSLVGLALAVIVVW